MTTISRVFTAPQDTCTIEITYLDDGSVVHVIAPAGTDMDDDGGGAYSYTFSDPDYDLVYSYTITATLVTTTTIVEGEQDGPQRPFSGVSYATEAEAMTYFEGRLNTDPWDNASSSDRNKALIMATRLMDRLNYAGAKTDSAQTLQFPRGGDVDIPDDIIVANCECALALLDGVDPELEFENLSMVSQGMNSARSTYDRSQIPEHLLAKIPSAIAWGYIKPYLRDSGQLDLFRVS